jgi:exonuclease III
MPAGNACATAWHGFRLKPREHNRAVLTAVCNRLLQGCKCSRQLVDGSTSAERGCLIKVAAQLDADALHACWKRDRLQARKLEGLRIDMFLASASMLLVCFHELHAACRNASAQSG